MSTTKRRAVISFENMSDELAAAFSEKYPKGYTDYFPDLVKYDKPDGTSFYAVTVEIPDAMGCLTGFSDLDKGLLRHCPR